MKKSERSIELDTLKWTVTRVNGKIASVSPGYKGTKGIVDQIVEKKMDDIVSITTELLPRSIGYNPSSCPGHWGQKHQSSGHGTYPEGHSGRGFGRQW